MKKEKEKIYNILKETEKENNLHIEQCKDKAYLSDYSGFVYEKEGCKVWSDALQKALAEHEFVYISASNEPYYIDKSVIIPSNRHIEAEEGVVIRQMEGVKVLMFRNEHTKDGTHKPIDGCDKDFNISINGGRWEESYRNRAGYGQSGMYDENRSYFGVSTCMFFNNIERLTLTNMTFAHTAGFAVQIGNAKNVVFKNIKFVSCYADGLHINGNTENVYAKNIEGEVGDDLVALNMYDWQNSSVNFGPSKNILCENLHLYEESRYKALRIEPGIYYYDDGTKIDCSINNIIIKNVKGIKTFKMYYQTPPYPINGEPESGNVGSGDNIFFENIEADLDSPIDNFTVYSDSKEVNSSCAVFEIGSNIKNISFENINVKLYKEKYPMSYLVCVGPKSVRQGEFEIFDPGLSSTVENMYLKNIKVNGKKISDIKDYVKEIVFDDIYKDGKASAKGEIKNIITD